MGLGYWLGGLLGSRGTGLVLGWAGGMFGVFHEIRRVLKPSPPRDPPSKEDAP